jgi:hypothetical protein
MKWTWRPGGDRSLEAGDHGVAVIEPGTSFAAPGLDLVGYLAGRGLAGDSALESTVLFSHGHGRPVFVSDEREAAEMEPELDAAPGGDYEHR